MGSEGVMVGWRSFLVFIALQGYGAAETPKVFGTNALLIIDLARNMLENGSFWP